MPAMALRSLEKDLRAQMSRRNADWSSSHCVYQPQNAWSFFTSCGSRPGNGSLFSFSMMPCGVRYGYIHWMT